MNERTIFLEALEQVDPVQQAAFLDTACAEDVSLRLRVESLLQSHGEAGSFLGKLAPERLAEELGVRASTGESRGQMEAGDYGQALSILAPSDKPDSLGRLGSYEVQEVIGRGGMGIVLRAFDGRLHRVVAIKVMTAPLASNEHARRRFVREGRAAAAIRDDHVIGIHGVDEASGLPFLVMEYVVGRSLAQRLEADGPLPLADILRIGSQIARGLAAAHAQGLVHRDIKPANILLENGVERVKITDFGLAHAVDDVRTTLPGTVIGTPEYMSPEQARGEKVDHRSDLFSLGCVLYAMCAGRPPFRAESTVATIRRVCDDTPQPLAEINPETPEWLVDLIDKLIAKNASERFQSAAEVAELLGQYLAHVQQPAVNPRPAAITKPRPLHRQTSAIARRRWSLAAAAVLLLCAGLSLAETTGVTKVAAAVIRIVRGDGTLVVEVDDPNIQVLLDGEELVITGAGPKELRLRPGQHELHTFKDGKASETKLITITRDGRQVVKVAHEQTATAPAVPTTRLVWAEAEDTSGAPSPDGRYLAFIDWDTGDLAVRDLATGQNRRLTNKGSWSESNEFAMYPKFSADSTQLAFTWYDKEGRASLRVVGVQGGDPRVVYTNTNRIDSFTPETCGWTPDGKAILAKLSGNSAASPPVEQSSRQLALISTADGSLRVVKSFESSRGRIGGISLAPDGRTIAYDRITKPGSANRDIFLLEVETGQETQVTMDAADKSILAWTPDGQRLLFDMERQGARDAWLIRIVGGKPQGEAELLRKDLGAILPQGFARDGTFYYGSSSQGPSLFTAKLDLETRTAIATPLAAEKFNITDQLRLGDWSPDGESIAYWAKSRVAEELRITSLKTGQVRVLKPDFRNMATRFRWSPDGRSFLFQNFGLAVFQVDAVSGEMTTVLERGGGRQPIWSRDGRGIFHVARPTGESIRIVHRDLQTGSEKEVPVPGNLVNRRSNFWFELSPDGRQLALLGESNSQSMGLWLIAVDSGESRQLVKVDTPDTRGGGVGWTPDGAYVLYTQLGGDESQRGLWSIPASGGQPNKVALSGVDAKAVSRFAMHPDGKQLAITAQGTGKAEVWAMENFLPPLADSAAPPVAGASVAKSKPAASTGSNAATAAAPQQPAMASPSTRQVWAEAGNESGSVAPDGRHFAFIDWENSGLLTVRNLATGENRQLTTNGPYTRAPEFVESPIFSPDGNRLAYTWYKSHGPGKWTYDLRVIGIAGGEPKSLHSQTEAYPQTYGWSPDGNSILVGLYVKAELQLAFIAVADGAVRTVKSLDGGRGKVGHVSLSPDGSTIAYSRRAAPGAANRSVFLMDAESGEETRSTTHGAHTDVLAWTPDSRRLLFTIERQGARDAWVMHIAAGKLQGAPQLVKADLGNVSPLGFASDGALFYGQSFSRPSAFTATLDLDKDTVTATALPGESFSVMDVLSVEGWSPDGRYLAYKARTGDRRFEIRVLSVNDGQARSLQPDLQTLSAFHWSPDGGSFITTSKKEPGGPNGIYQIDSTTGNITTLVEPEDGIVGAGARWAPDGQGIFYGKGRNGIIYRDVQNKSEREILAPGNADFASLRFDVSRDGRQLAVMGMAKDTGVLIVRRIAVEGGASQDLLKGDQKTGLGWVTWTPDGKGLLFTRYGPDENLRGLWYVSADGGQPRCLKVSGVEDTQVFNMAVHPDGKQLAFTTSAYRRYEVWAMENFLPPLADPQPSAAADASAAKGK